MVRKMWLLVSMVFIFASFNVVAYQETSSGEQVAKLFPKEVIGYIAVQDIQDGIAQSKKMLAKWFGKEEADNLVKSLNDLIQQGLDYVPEQLRKDIKGGIKELSALHFIIFDVGEHHLTAALVLESTSEKTFPALLKDLRLNFKETFEVEKTTIYRWETGEREPAPNIFLTTFGKYGLATTNIEIAKDSIKRFNGTTTSKTSLADNPYFKKVNTTHKNGFNSSLFVDIDKVIRLATASSGRRGRFEFDRVDTVLGISRIKAATGSVYYSEDSEMVSESAVLFDQGCTLWDLVRQETAEKEVLSLIPSDSLMAAAYTVNDAGKTWKRIKKMVGKNEKAFGLKEGEWDKTLEDMAEVKKEIGVSLDEFFDACGDEVGFYMDGVQALAMGNMPKFAMIFEGKTKEASSAVWEKMKQSNMFRNQSWEEEEYKDYKIYFVTSVNRWEPAWAYTFIDKFLVLGSDKEAVKKIIDTNKNNKSIAKDKNTQKALSKVPAKNVGFIMFNMKKYYNIMEQAFMAVGAMGGMPPGFSIPSSDKMPDDLIDIAVTVDKDSEWVCQGYGSSGGSAISSVAVVAAIAIPSMMMMRGTRGFDQPTAQDDIILAEPVTLPQDEQEAKKVIAQLIKDLGDNSQQKRTDATKKLKVLGKKEESKKLVIPAVQEALKIKDAEVKLRAKDILAYCNEFSAMPDVVKEKVKNLMTSLDAKDEWQTRKWDNANDEDSRHMEPNNSGYSFYYPLPAKAEDLQILESDAGVEELAKALLNKDNSTNMRRNIAWLMTQYDSKTATKTLLKAIGQERDESIKLFSITALGWSDDEKTKERVKDALTGEKLGERRAAFLAIERSTDTAWIDELTKLLKSEDDETRFNAGYTLEKMTGGGGGVRFNAFEKENNRAKSIEILNGWWKTNKANFKIERKDFSKGVRGLSNSPQYGDEPQILFPDD